MTKQVSKAKPKKAPVGKGSINHHDMNGTHVKSGMDLCDCLDKNCVGCHYPCKNCRSQKCGQICRNNRKSRYEQVSVEGTNMTFKHPAKSN